MSTLKTSEAAAIIGISDNALRALGHRHPEFQMMMLIRTKGNHRRFDRESALCIRQAYDEGLLGQSAVERAMDLKRVGYFKDKTIHQRLDQIEKTLQLLCRRLEMK